MSVDHARYVVTWAQKSQNGSGLILLVKISHEPIRDVKNRSVGKDKPSQGREQGEGGEPTYTASHRELPRSEMHLKVRGGCCAQNQLRTVLAQGSYLGKDPEAVGV